MTNRILIALIVGMLLATAGSASAQRRPGMWGSVLPPLTDEDIDIIRQTTRVDMTDKPVGTVLPWENPKSGASGNVTLLKRFEMDGRECRTVRHYIEPRRQEPWDHVLTLCLQADGAWKWTEMPRPYDPQTDSHE